MTTMDSIDADKIKRTLDNELKQLKGKYDLLRILLCLAKVVIIEDKLKKMRTEYSNRASK